MDSANPSTTCSSSINVNLEIRIESFMTAGVLEKKVKCIEETDRNFDVWFSVSMSTNGFGKDTEGWLIVRPYVTVTRPQSSVLSWTISLIDVKRKARFLKSFMQDLSKDITDAKYLEKSFILDRADDFLIDGVLTGRCDVCFQWYNDSPSSSPDNDREIAEPIIPDVPELDQSDICLYERAESSDWESEGFTVGESLEIRLENFNTNKEKAISKPIEYCYRYDSGFSFYASVKDIDGWLAVRPNVNMNGMFSSLPNKFLGWIVNIIDIEGEPKIPRSFEIEYNIRQCIVLGLDEEYDALQKRLEKSDRNITCAKYLERSFILSRSDEFLRNGVLTLRCDISLSCPMVSSSYLSRVIFERGYRPFESFVALDDNAFSFIDLRSRDLTTGCSYWNKEFNISGNFPHSESSTTASKDDEEDQVWTFVTRSDEFFMKLDKRQNSVGTRLLKASPVIRLFVSWKEAYDAHQTMQFSRKEQPKNIELLDVHGEVFKIVLFFLGTEKLPMLTFDELVSVYKLSHFLCMKKLRQKCAEDMINSYGYFEELEEIADFYSDSYLSELLPIDRKRNKNVETDFQQLRANDTPYSDCYI